MLLAPGLDHPVDRTGHQAPEFVIHTCAPGLAAGKWVKRRFRLTRSTDFQRVRRIGKSYAHPLAVLVAAHNELEFARIGIVAGRTVGSAVHRNLAKRRMRACLDPLLACLPSGWDLIFLARKPMDQAGFSEICSAMQVLLKRAGLLNERS